MRRLLMRIVALIAPGRAEDELAREIDAHLALLQHEHEKRGLAPHEARLAARRAFGGVEQVKVRHREARSLPVLEQSWHDLRFAWRGLRHTKGLTTAAVLTLAVGIAGSTAMFALVKGVLLRPLPVHDQDRLLVAWKELRLGGLAHYPFRVRDIDAVASASRTLERVAGVDYNGAVRLAIVEDERASYINAAAVTGDFFDVLGVTPALGRSLTRNDDLSGAEKVLVISHGLWQRRYAGATTVLGRRLRVGSRQFTIVGVMPREFEYPRNVEAWMTTARRADGSSWFVADATAVHVDLIARLRAGVTREQAAEELQRQTAHLDIDAPRDAPRGLTTVVHPYADVIVGDVRKAMLVLFGAVGLVLLLASANAATLLLLRSEAKRVDFSVRSALGASRGRLTRQALAESLLVALCAGAFGLAATWWTLQGLVALVPEGLPRAESVRVDAGVVAFAIAAAFLTAALAGIAPVWSVARTDAFLQLRNAAGGAVNAAVPRIRRALVVAQIALAVMVIAVAALLIRTLTQLQTVDMGLATDRLVFVSLLLPEGKYAERPAALRFLSELVAQLEAAPDIAGATPVNVRPFAGTGGWDAPRFTAEGQDAAQAATNPSVNLESPHPNYFETLQVALVRGRAFNERDTDAAPRVAIVSEDVGSRVWPDQNPIGKRVKLGPPESGDAWRTIVGVAKPTRYRDLAQPRPTLYLPPAQFNFDAQMLVLRTGSPPASVLRLVRARVRAVDPAVQIMQIAPFSEMLERPLARPRFNAFVIGVFGVEALILAGIGLYAMIAASVRLRDTEMGVRVALGATASDVRGLVFGEGLRLAGAGAAIGLVCVVATTRVLRGLLFDVHPLDPPALLSAALLVTGVSVLACYLPARRASRTDPARLLRSS